MNSTIEYLSCADTAKLIRQALKREFPGVKFSVRSHTYAGGASIDVGWTDGPTDQQVEAVTAGFAGGRFDGMIDMAYNVVSWLEEDGTAHVASNPGTGGQRGTDPGMVGDPMGGGARMVHFGADYVFTDRELSAELVEWLASFALRNGHSSTGRCEGCGGWDMPEDCWTAHLDRGHSVQTVFCCSPTCAGKVTARGFSDV